MHAMYGQLYRQSRDRVSEFATALTDAQLEVPSDACPGWTVGDVLRHLVGGAKSFATGDMEGAPGPEWTSGHITARAGRNVPELLDEWAQFAPAIEAQPDDFRMWLPCLHDVLAHETDFTAPLGGPRTPVDAIRAAMPLIEARLPTRFDGLGAVRLVLDGHPLTVGDGDPAITVETELFEFWRGYFGRRSAHQMKSWVTSGDAEAFAAKLPVFPARPSDLAE